jgi:hypothetical protein
MTDWRRIARHRRRIVFGLVAMIATVTALAWRQVARERSISVTSALREEAIRSIARADTIVGDSASRFPVEITRSDPEYDMIVARIESAIGQTPARRLKPVSICQIDFVSALDRGDRLTFVISPRRLEILAPETGETRAAFPLPDSDIDAINRALETVGARRVRPYWFYPTGERRATGYFAAGLPHGEWTFYRKDGSKESWGTFVDGAKVGKWSYIDENGDVTVREE